MSSGGILSYAESLWEIYCIRIRKRKVIGDFKCHLAAAVLLMLCLVLLHIFMWVSQSRVRVTWHHTNHTKMVMVLEPLTPPTANYRLFCSIQHTFSQCCKLQRQLIRGLRGSLSLSLRPLWRIKRCIRINTYQRLFLSTLKYYNSIACLMLTS